MCELALAFSMHVGVQDFSKWEMQIKQVQTVRRNVHLDIVVCLNEWDKWVQTQSRYKKRLQKNKLHK